MLIHLGFSGWFQCRLATDPDPFDEPRGVTGWTFALPGEPDLDRVIRLQPEGCTIRTGCEPMTPGVRVDRVVYGDELQPDHPLVGAPVRLAAQGGRPPVFEGRNSVVAGDTIEPIVPLSPLIGDGPATIGRAAEHRYTFPFARHHGRRGLPGTLEHAQVPEFIGTTTGVDIAATWRDRVTALQSLLSTASPIERAALTHRLDAIRRQLMIGMFGELMSWSVALIGPVHIGEAALLPSAAVPADDVPWAWRLWMGAWDVDSLCGYAVGSLTIPTDGDTDASPPNDWWDRRRRGG